MNDINRIIAEKLFLATGVAMSEFNGRVYSRAPGFWHPLPDYINDLAAVFGPGGVVEKMADRRFALSLRHYVDGHNLAQFYRVGDPKHAHAGAFNSSITEAVCLAALAALDGSNG